MRDVQRLPEASDAYRWKMDPSSGEGLQEAFLGMLGHDLRQPLQIIQGTYSLLRSSIRTASEQAWLDRGQSAIDRLIEQLNRLLATLRFYDQTKGLEISAVAVAPLLTRVRLNNEEAARQRRIEIRVCVSGTSVRSNPVLLEGIVGNLVANAIKYTEPGGRILIGSRRSGPKVRIEVHDTGIGIPPQQLPRIFNAFERLDPTRNDGLGVGLFVVRRALEVLGHEIEVKSAISQGSRFSVIATAAESAISATTTAA